jgi:pimeloyl-ACP methyl ester carboxylesterase
MGLYDSVANIEAITAAAGVEKMFYVGYSQGTIQMHYGLAHLESTFYADHLHKAVMLAPCFVPHVPNWTKFEANRTIMDLQQSGVYALYGPNWEEDLKVICRDFWGVLCEYYSHSDSQGLSVRSEQYWVMNGLTDRFQEFAYYWADGITETTLVDVSNIKQVPIAFFTATNDEVCPHKTANLYIPQFQSETTQIDVEGEGHLWFASYANTDWFMVNLIEQL